MPSRWPQDYAVSQCNSQACSQIRGNARRAISVLTDAKRGPYPRNSSERAWRSIRVLVNKSSTILAITSIPNTITVTSALR